MGEDFCRAARQKKLAEMSLPRHTRPLNCEPKK